MPYAGNIQPVAPVMEEAKKALPLPVEDKLLSPSELAEIYYERTGNKLSKLGSQSRGSAL